MAIIRPSLAPENVRADERRDPLRVLAVRTDVDHGVARVAVHIGNRREVHLHAKRARLERRDARLFTHQAQAVLARNRAHGHLPWKRRGAEDAKPDTGLEVGGVQQRHRRHRLQPIDQERGGKRLTQDDRSVVRVQQNGGRRLGRSEYVKTADVILAHQLRQHVERVAVGAQEVRLERRDDELADFLVGRKLLQRLLDPPLGGAVQRERIARRGMEDERNRNDTQARRPSRSSSHPRVALVAARHGRIVARARATMPRMSQAEHKARAPKSVHCFVVTVSDTRTEETDTSGRAIADLLTTAGHVVSGHTILKDDADLVRGTLERQLASASVQAIILTGGTGITARDNTYEVVSALLQKRLDGFGELFRMLSFQEIGPAAMMSRACAGIAAGHIIVLLPGSGSGRAPRDGEPADSRASDTSWSRQGARDASVRIDDFPSKRRRSGWSPPSGQSREPSACGSKTPRDESRRRT